MNGLPQYATHSLEYQLLATIVAMAVLQLIMHIWLYATRIPAMFQAKISSNKATKAKLETLPKWATNVADNYNHLFESPTVYYAMVLAIVLMGLTDQSLMIAGWVFVGLRYIHSLVQATINIIMLRFAIFSLSWVALGFMIIKSVIAIMGQ